MYVLIAAAVVKMVRRQDPGTEDVTTLFHLVPPYIWEGRIGEDIFQISRALLTKYTITQIYIVANNMLGNMHITRATLIKTVILLVMYQMTVALDNRYGTGRSHVEDCEGEVHRISPGTCVLVVVLVLYTIVPPGIIQT